MSYLEINLHVSIEDKEISGLDLTVEQGKVLFTIMGPNGTGKSTNAGLHLDGTS